jgi:hypothetical protein
MFALISICLIFGSSPVSASVEVTHNQLVIDGQAQPQLFGAELQYFRLRGGYGRNIPRATVIALWNKALDRLVEAHMNSVSFYIPWDFHEYAEGKFDFDGTADEDGDGNPDYPARDIHTFFRLLAEHGITKVQVRPGPYINAEWGFLGFGAIPQWFHEKYPESHMHTAWGWKHPLHDYHNPDFLRHTQIWFETLYREVLKDQIGPGKPIKFLQLDNETNFQWQSLSNADFGAPALGRYRDFLQNKYTDLSTLNRAQETNWSEWNQVQAPADSHKQIAQDRDWYSFNDQTIYTYLHKIRLMWENLGVKEPDVIFTLAESYNGPDNGLLPNYVYKNKRGFTGLMTVNLYPKTGDTPESPLLNQPFKSDLDVKSATEAGNYYFGTENQEWSMGPEIQGGWFADTTVSAEARRQTYLSTIGHGLKALYVYYFNEGQNWDVEWGYNRVKPIFNRLRTERKVENIPVKELSNEFWGELQSRCDQQIIMGLEARQLMERDRPLKDEDLHFDAPLDPDANPRPYYYELKLIGERLIAPYQDFLSRAVEASDDIAIVKDSTAHQPSGKWEIDSGLVNTDWAGALLGNLMNIDLNPRILFGDISAAKNFEGTKVLLHIDTGFSADRTKEQLKAALSRGQSIVNILSDDTALALGAPAIPSNLENSGNKQLTFYLNSKGELASNNTRAAKTKQISSQSTLFTYDLRDAKGCTPILFWEEKVAGYSCSVGKGKLIQLGAMAFVAYNSNDYSKISGNQKIFMRSLLKEFSVASSLKITGAQRTVAFARKDPQHRYLWITVKTGSDFAQKFRIQINPKLLKNSVHGDSNFKVSELLAIPELQSKIWTREQLTKIGFSVNLEANGSKVFLVEGL